MVVGEFTVGADVLVIGGGPGGYVAAIRAAQLGKSVTLIEKNDLGGVCLNRGCIPSKAIISMADFVHRMKTMETAGIRVNGITVEMERLQQWKQGVVQKLTQGVASLCKGNQITVVQGEASFVSANEVRVVTEHGSERYRFESCIIATGSYPVELSGIPFDGQRVISSTEALSLKKIPQQLLVVGGGYIGLELGTAYRKLGSEVTVLEGTGQILPGTDPGLVRYVTRNLKKLGVEVQTNALATSLQINGEKVDVTVRVKDETKVFSADQVLVTVGRKPYTGGLELADSGIETNEQGFIKVDRQQRTTNPKVFAIGDVTGNPMLAHKASYEGKVAAEVIAGLPSEMDAVVIPSVIFTDPEIASVGWTEEQAKQEGYETLTGRFPFGANGRALSMEGGDGFVQVIAEKQTKRVLGVHIVGPEASNLIAEATLAIEMCATLEDLSLTVHAHPTLPETIMEAAEAAVGHAIHILNK
ncbi:dihydrolipoyl dehydrogenase [Effusibacillus dendaii]|uniref:Dihydrolipoyl dehydrogenase n=1 Tax=Effusibacillus dendaii TaxID=2743772 RepID=A0A7I8DC21_9BACL|nr:dihydrolipoyl dehydrogenase [Effusibacillus dendaii]BCJ85471.1 dihydrolipoyl dehydrogenase [Effusibacillus dendaii]